MLPLVVIQRNPVSGSGRGRSELLRLVSVLRGQSFHVRMFSSRRRLDEFVRHPVQQARLRCLVAAGGDGTVADLTNRHPGTSIALFPMGTENLLARYLKIPRCGRTVAAMIVQNRVAVLDSALAGEHRFLLMLSTGVDADVVRRLHTARTGHIGHHSYVVPILSGFLGFEPEVVEAIGDSGQTAAGVHLIITNVPAYGFGFRFSPEADPTDGLLDVRAFVGPGKLRTLLHAVSVKLRCPWSESGVMRFRTRELTLRTRVSNSPSSFESGGQHVPRAELPVQCDGDPGPSVPLHIRVDPASLHVLIPADRPRF